MYQRIFFLDCVTFLFPFSSHKKSWEPDLWYNSTSPHSNISQRETAPAKPSRSSSPLSSMSSSYYSSSEALQLTDNLPPNPTLLIFALALTISLYPLIDYTLHLLLVISSFKPQQRQQQRTTTHRDLLLLYLTIIITSLALISLWYYWYLWWSQWQ